MKEKRSLESWFWLALAVLVSLLMAEGARAQFGPVLTGAGPISRSMGGVATATPLSASGALLWNPATLSGFQRSQMDFGMELIFPDTQLASRIPANGLGLGIPPIGLAGEASSDSGAFPVPNLGVVYRPEGSPLSFGLGLFGIAGFGVDYAGSNFNPLLTPPPPNGVGFGSIYSEYQVIQLTPAVSYQITDRFSVAVGANVDLASLKLDPTIFVAPDDANGDGFRTYPQGTHSRTTWGGGFVVGAYYRADSWSLGASVRSPQWFDEFRYNAHDELGRGRSFTLDVDLPMIVSIGAAYTGVERLVVGMDLRYLDFENADGFDRSGFAADGSVRGVGWESIFAVALGAQYQLTQALALRAGYVWNENPIPGDQAAVNAASPTILEHTVSVGASWNVTRDWKLSAAYLYGFQNSIEGPVVTPLGAVPGSSVKNTTLAHVFILGASVQFGAPRRCQLPKACCEPDRVLRQYRPAGGTWNPRVLPPQLQGPSRTQSHSLLRP